MGFQGTTIKSKSSQVKLFCFKHHSADWIGNAVEYFDPTYLESFKEKVEEVIYSNSRIKELKLLGKAKSQNYSWEKCANETLKIYSKFTKS